MVLKEDPYVYPKYGDHLFSQRAAAVFTWRQYMDNPGAHGMHVDWNGQVISCRSKLTRGSIMAYIRTWVDSHELANCKMIYSLTYTLT